MTSALRSRCIGAVAGLLIDRLLGEPPNELHPVAWFGTAMQKAESKLWADQRRHGIAYAATGIALGATVGRLSRSTTAMVALTVAGRELRAVADRIGNVTSSQDLAAARAELPSLVGRDPSQLDASGISAAVIESVAENSVDAVVAPVFWAILAGPAGAAGYRAINTMDAMVGHRSERYENFGWAAARIDDVANYVPARIFAALVAMQDPARAGELLTAIRRDAGAHPSPNAGVAETAMAATLGCELGGPLHYGDRLENRPTLGQGPRPVANDIARATSVASRAEIILAAALAATALIRTVQHS